MTSANMENIIIDTRWCQFQLFCAAVQYLQLIITV